ncbi:hypothetical protein KI387_009634, partial [Taxus chinensis]
MASSLLSGHVSGLVRHSGCFWAHSCLRSGLSLVSSVGSMGSFNSAQWALWALVGGLWAQSGL